MISNLLLSEIQLFINSNIDGDIKKLALQKNPFPDVDYKEILQQIEAKSKSRQKLPSWFKTRNIIYPLKISIEQTSSEKTAAYKSTIISGQSIIDLTGGFGVDTYYFSKNFHHVIHCELNAELSAFAKHNFKILNVNNVECINGESTSILEKLSQKFDYIYIDPSRRNDVKGKVFMLKDCSPDVPNNLDFYFKFSSRILIKTAPLLDISAGLSELKCVKNIHIVAVENEVKEILWEIKKDYLGQIEIITVNITKEKTDKFNFKLNDQTPTILFGKPEKYLYEPNAAIMKSGGFNEIGIRYNVSKLHQNSHLYTSFELITFPGRRFKICKSLLYKPTEMNEYLKNTNANITTRNFPDSVDYIRKKWNIKDGGNIYCFFTTNNLNDKIVLICNKV